MSMDNARLEFDCPHCKHTINVPMNQLGPEVMIRCGGCQELIPAGVFYADADDSAPASQ